MAFNPLSGTDSSVMVASNALAAQKFKISVKTKIGTVNTMASLYQATVGGITSATIVIDMPYDQGNIGVPATGLTSGAVYPVLLTYTTSITTSISCRFEGYDIESDVDAPAQKVTLTFQSNSAFTPIIV